jgi:hypothetical protein
MYAKITALLAANCVRIRGLPGAGDRPGESPARWRGALRDAAPGGASQASSAGHASPASHFQPFSAAADRRSTRCSTPPCRLLGNPSEPADRAAGPRVPHRHTGAWYLCPRLCFLTDHVYRAPSVSSSVAAKAPIGLPLLDGPMAAGRRRKPALTRLFPARLRQAPAGSSRPLRSKKARRAGPPLRCGLSGSCGPRLPWTVPHQQGDGRPAAATRRLKDGTGTRNT